MKPGFESRQSDQSHAYNHYTNIEGIALCSGYDIKLGNTVQIVKKSVCFSCLSYSIGVIIAIFYLPHGAVSKINKVV